MTIESDGIATVVSREYEVEEIDDVRMASGAHAIQTDEPALPNITRAVALAAAIAHHPKEN